jgi:hypothetical protein
MSFDYAARVIRDYGDRAARVAVRARNTRAANAALATFGAQATWIAGVARNARGAQRRRRCR